jgi:hypothetical protein
MKGTMNVFCHEIATRLTGYLAVSLLMFGNCNNLYYWEFGSGSNILDF